jgi:hypothetical protein
MTQLCCRGLLPILFAGGAIFAGSAAAAPRNEPLPSVMHVCVVHCSTFILEQDHYTNFQDGGNATLTVESFTRQSVVLRRADRPNAKGRVLTGVYRAKMESDGERITNGTVHWTDSGTNSFAAAWGQALDTLPGKDIKAATDSAGSVARGRDAARRGDVHQAFSSFLAAAQAGSAGAQNIMGYSYEHGIGVAADPAAAFQWYGQAAERESTWGLENASRFLREGLASPADPAAADRLHARADELRKRHTRFCTAPSTLQAMQSLERKMYNDPNGQTLQLLGALATGLVMDMGVPHILDAKAMDDRQRWGKFEVDLASDPGAFVCEALFLHTKARVQELPGGDAAAQLTGEAITALTNKFPSYVDTFSIAPEPGGVCRLTLLPSAIELARRYSDIIPGRASAQKHADESLTWVGCNLE